MPIPGSRFQKFVPGIVKFFFNYCMYIKTVNKKIVYKTNKKKTKK